MDGPPPLNESISVEETLPIVDDTIEKKQHVQVAEELPTSLLASNFQRNSLLPISRLPPEIVLYVFTLVQITEPDSTEVVFRERGLGQAHLNWIKLTHVYRHWRDIALSSSSLWVDLPIGNRHWVGEMLKRSRNSSLVVKVSQWYPLPDPGLELAFKHFQRIKALSLQSVPKAIWNGLHGMLPTSAPQLESLCIEGLLPYSQNPGGTHDFTPLLISDDVLRQTERLRQLRLTNCEVNWNSHSHLLRSLTHLKLKVLVTSALTEMQLMDALKGMPELEVLELSDVFRFRTDGQASRPSKNIHLACLRALDITSKYSDMDAFFRWVTFPATTTVRVVCYGQPGRDFSIFDFARSYSNATRDTPFQSLIVRQAIGDEQGIRLKFFTEALNDSDMLTHADTTAHLELVFYCSGRSLILKILLGDIFSSAIPLYDITHIFFAERIPWFKAEAIANTLGKLPRVHSVMVGEDTPRSFFNAMRLGSQNATQPVYFPCVSSICLHNTAFLETWMLNPEDTSVGISLELLRQFLMERCELGAPIDTLILRICLRIDFISLEKDVKLLEEIVVDVDWDGYTFSVIEENADILALHSTDMDTDTDTD